MIGEANRQNPYVIQIIESMEPLKHLAIEKSVVFTRNLIYGFLVNTIFGVLTFSLWSIPFYLILFIVQMLSMSLIYRFVMKHNPLAEITRIIYGNQYEKIYVNNEILLNIIEDVAFFKGMLRVLGNACNYITYCTIIISAFSCLMKWVMYFLN